MKSLCNTAWRCYHQQYNMYNQVDCTNKQYKMYNARTLKINNVSLGLF